MASLVKTKARFVVATGCPGAGKSSTAVELCGAVTSRPVAMRTNSITTATVAQGTEPSLLLLVNSRRQMQRPSRSPVNQSKPSVTSLRSTSSNKTMSLLLLSSKMPILIHGRALIKWITLLSWRGINFVASRKGTSVANGKSNYDCSMAQMTAYFSFLKMLLPMSMRMAKKRAKHSSNASM